MLAQYFFPWDKVAMTRYALFAAMLFILLSLPIAYADCGLEENLTEFEKLNASLMRPDAETRDAWIASYENAPKFNAPITPKPMRAMGSQGPETGISTSVDLLPYLEYLAEERDQGSCGNCWVWAGTGVLEIALNKQTGIRDRLSIQYLDSCRTVACACNGGWLANLTSFYQTTRQAIPWSNTNANWRDGGAAAQTTVQA